MTLFRTNNRVHDIVVVTKTTQLQQFGSTVYLLLLPSSRSSDERSSVAGERPRPHCLDQLWEFHRANRDGVDRRREVVRILVQAFDEAHIVEAGPVEAVFREACDRLQESRTGSLHFIPSVGVPGQCSDGDEEGVDVVVTRLVSRRPEAGGELQI